MNTTTSYCVYHYDAFSSIPGKGNPAGVVFSADSLDAVTQQYIATQVGFNETVFVLRSTKAACRLRYFTPGHEVDLCGHATIAALYGLYDRQALSETTLPIRLEIETRAGILPVQFMNEHASGVQVQMAQPSAQFRPFQGDLAVLAGALGLEQTDILDEWPVMYGSTGLWTLVVPVKGLHVMRQMRPQNNRFPDILTEMPRVSIHPFCVETYDSAADLHGRHFSSPYSGTREDPVTGTASGVLGAYWVKYIQQERRTQATHHLCVEQGQEHGFDGRVGVCIQKQHEELCVQIRGTATYVATRHIPHLER